MGPIGRAIDDCMFRLPRRILETVFVKRQRWTRTAPLSVHDSIYQSVIKPRVLIDCDIVGGVEAMIDLTGLDYEQVDEFTRVYEVPKSRTGGKSILSVMDILFTDPNRNYSNTSTLAFNSNTMLQAGQAAVDTHASLPMMSTHRCQIVGENILMIRDQVSLPDLMFARCQLSNDPNLSNIQIRSYKAFEKLVELAVKSYIYNEYIVDMDMGELMGGVQLGVFKNVIDGWADAEEMYQTHLETVWQKVAFMNDNESYTRYINLMIGGYR